MTIAPLRQALSWRYARRSLVVAAVVGTLLNLINQGHVLFGDAEFRLWTALLTYCVPFCVSTYGVSMSFAADEDVAPIPDPAIPQESVIQGERP